jgi:hypothetical protein
MEIEEYIAFRLINKNSGYYVHSDDEGKGSIRLYNEINDKCQLFYFEKINNGIRIRNLNSGYFIHCDDNGKGNLRQYYELNNICQLFELQNDKFINKNSKYYIHGDNDGKGNLRMYNISNDICQRFNLIYHNFDKIDTSIKKYINNTQELDNYLVDLDNPNRYCGINNKNWTDISNNKNRMKPIFAYLKYVEKKLVPGGMEQTYEFKKIKGTVKTWSISVNITQSVEASIGFAQSNTSISLGFDYSKQISEQTEETWTQKVTGPVTYYVYQPVIVFALDQPNGYNSNSFGTKLFHLTRNNPFTSTTNIQGVESNEADYIIAKNKEKWTISSIIL